MNRRPRENEDRTLAIDEPMTFPSARFEFFWLMATAMTTS
jgi:hypothetical protein